MAKFELVDVTRLRELLENSVVCKFLYDVSIKNQIYKPEIQTPDLRFRCFVSNIRLSLFITTSPLNTRLLVPNRQKMVSGAILTLVPQMREAEIIRIICRIFSATYTTQINQIAFNNTNICNPLRIFIPNYDKTLLFYIFV